MPFATPDDLDRFIDELRADLQAAGLQGAAERLAALQGTAFTTGSEWLGELGLAVKEIRRKYLVPPEVDTRLSRAMKHGSTRLAHY